jgi:hypothetical protein
VIQALKDAFAQDRLTRDELGARAGLALTARTLPELAALTGDIPAPLAAPAPGRPGLVQRHPLLWGFAGSGGCVAIAFGLVMLAANVLDPHGLGNPPTTRGARCAPWWPWPPW